MDESRAEVGTHKRTFEVPQLTPNVVLCIRFPPLKLSLTQYR
jgi:hypothetical protein